jgi:eukaryotic-like serine/threonine-protein kinase
VNESSSPESAAYHRFSGALAGQYALEREIGRGGMGVVYRARDLKLDRLVAIKTLPPHLAADGSIRERFLREARTAASLSHPNIVPIYRADEIDGFVFFVMAYVDGESLAERIRARGSVSPPEVVRALCDVSDALGYAHGRGVVHRDVKAENILLERTSGRAMVTDFGIARVAEAAPLTATGQVLGTVYYMSPEQISGDSVDARSDVYELGVVGFYALSGRFPFNAELASAVLVAHVTKPAPPLREVAPDAPPTLSDIIDRCLCKRPADRFQSCTELHAALSSVEQLVAAESHERASANRGARARLLLSDTEAQDILARAAELQASTGIQPRPAPVVGSREGRPRAPDGGHQAANVRDAALEAGIAREYVDHALLEHGVTPTGTPAPPPIGIVDRSRGANAFIGSPTQLEYETVVDGEMPERDFDLLVDTIRKHTGEAGQLASIGRSFAWRSDPHRGAVNVSLLPRGGKTTIRVSESARPLAAGIFVGIVGAIGFGSVPIWMGVALHASNAGAGAALAGGVLVLTWATARALFARSIGKHEQGLRDLAEELAVQARESIAAHEVPRLGS